MYSSTIQYTIYLSMALGNMRYITSQTINIIQAWNEHISKYTDLTDDTNCCW